MKSLVSVFKYVGAELLIVFIYIFLLNNFIGNTKDTINSDGFGYYDYLPSIFIHGDLVRKDLPIEANQKKYERVVKVPGYNKYKDFEVNKYPCGTALLQTPFFLCAYLLSPKDATGFEPLFHVFIFYSSVFYVLLSLIFLRRLLISYAINRYIIFFVQLLTVLATSVTIYAQFNAAFSHVYSLFAISAFLYFARFYFVKEKDSYLLWSALFLGLIYDIRHVNILIVLFLPFIAGSWSNFVNGIRKIFSNLKILFSSILIFIAIVAIQHYLVFLQTGEYFVYAYGDERFNFDDPYFYSILFSYKKGLFIYTPVIFIATLSTIWFLYHKKFYLFFTWFTFFVVITYTLSSWWCWYYGCSFGLRAFVDFYPVFFIPLAIVLNGLSKVPKIIFISTAFLTIPLNIIQTYEYKEFVFDWVSMNKERYWEVFLKTANRYKGLIAKEYYDMSQFNIPHEIYLKEVKIPPSTSIDIIRVQSNEIPNINTCTKFQLSFESFISETNEARVVATIYGKTIEYYHQVPFIHFRDKKLNTYQRGQYVYSVDLSKDNGDNIITICMAANNDSIVLKDVKLTFMSPK